MILMGFLALNSYAQAQTGFHLDMEPLHVPWSHLSFHAKNFGVEVSTDIYIRARRASELEAELIASPKGIPVKAQASQVNEMTINTIIDPRFRSPVNIHNRIWFNPSDASALGRVRLRRGEDDFKKMYRFTEQGVFRHRMEPKDRGEAGLEPEKWSDIKDTFYPYDINKLNCDNVSERSVLIYVLSDAAILKNNTPLTLCIFGKRHLHRVQLQASGIQPVKINYIEKNQQVETRKEGTLKALKITINAQPMEKSGMEDVENFSFLGFHGEVSIYVEPVSGLPIQVSGIIPAIGRADLKLNKVQLKD
ncbi:MAG: hypothetical protein PVI00_04840 [Desulfobacterales bacterium]|jgi:hypothetical protein